MFRKPLHAQGLETVITQLAQTMRETPPDTPEFDQMMVQLERLYKLQTDTRKERVSPDTLAIVLGNLAGIVMILTHERANVVTSKALGFVLKAR